MTCRLVASIAILSAFCFGQSVTVSPCVFAGSGLNEATCGGSYVGVAANHQYTATIAATGTPDTVMFSRDGGAATAATNIVSGAMRMAYPAGTVTAVSFSAGRATYTDAGHGLTTNSLVTIAGTSPAATNAPVVVIDSSHFSISAASNPGLGGGIALANDGVTITFAATTGHSSSASWISSATATGSISTSSYVYPRPGGMVARNAQAKLSDHVSALDFTAGDGVHSDYLGIASAVAALRKSIAFQVSPGGSLDFPALPNGRCYLLSQQLVVQGFQNININGVGWGACIQWTGGTNGPAILFLGNYHAQMHNIRIVIPPAHPISGAYNAGSVVELANNTGVQPSTTSQQFLSSDVWVDCSGNCQYGFLSDGADNGTDANNDFHIFERTLVLGAVISGYTFVGSQSYSHVLRDSFINGFYPVGTISGATWSAGAATFTYSGIPVYAGSSLFLSGVAPSGYNVLDCQITAIDATHFSCPLTSNPGSFVSGGTVTGWTNYGIQAMSTFIWNGTGSGGAASFHVDGGAYGSAIYDFWISGYSAFAYDIAGFNNEENGGELLYANSIPSKIILRNGRFARTNAGTDTDFVHVIGSSLTISSVYANSFTASAPQDVTLYYLPQGNPNGEPSAILQDVHVTTSMNTPQTFFTSGSPWSGYAEWHNLEIQSLDNLTHTFLDGARDYSPQYKIDSLAATSITAASENIPGSVPRQGYSTGTISVTNGSTTVTGTGTSWTASMAGGAINIAAIPYLISSVGGATSITISQNYAGATASGSGYSINFGGSLQVNNGTNAGQSQVEIGTAADGSFHPVVDTGDIIRGAIIGAESDGGNGSIWCLGSRTGSGGSATIQYAFCATGKSGWSKLVPTTLASLSGVPQGAIAFVTDSTSNVIGHTTTRGGSNAAIVASLDGFNWYVVSTASPASSNAITALTGDVTATGPGSVAATLASTGSAGSCGDATHACQLTFDAKGRETARAQIVINGGATGTASFTASCSFSPITGTACANSSCTGVGGTITVVTGGSVGCSITPSSMTFTGGFKQ